MAEDASQPAGRFLCKRGSVSLKMISVGLAGKEAPPFPCHPNLYGHDSSAFSELRSKPALDFSHGTHGRPRHRRIEDTEGISARPVMNAVLELKVMIWSAFCVSSDFQGRLRRGLWTRH